MSEKLIRAKIADFLRTKGERPEVRIAEPHERLLLLREKLIEEVSELIEVIDAYTAQYGYPGKMANTAPLMAEELADVMEVVDTFASHFNKLVGGFPHSMQARKAEERGDFNDFVVLKMADPVALTLTCPRCGGRHIDRGIWATTRVHRTHLCEHCGNTWKPFDYPTIGVA